MGWKDATTPRASWPRRRWLVVAALERLRDLAWAYEVVGEARWYCDDLDGAAAAYRQARTLFDELGVQEGVMLTEHHFGQIARRRGEYDGGAAALSHRAGACPCAGRRTHGRALSGRPGALAAAAAGEDGRAATLLAAAWQRFDRFPPFLAPCDEADYQHVRSAVAARMTPQSLDAASLAGQTLTIDAVLAEG
jgi:hypothetical protein